ncbi:MAG TPA: glycosyltransferase [Candidatus Lokiarchaeia archaeon]|nr:glycosyltransferase [Candidatus Lokiarchaeia archaeon]
MKRLSIGIFSEMFTEMNGTANASRHLAYTLARYGHDVHVFAPGDFHIERKNLTYHKVGSFHLSHNPETYFNLPLYKYIAFRQYKFLDVLHSQTPLSTGGGLALHLASNLGIPIIGTHHSPLAFYAPQFIPIAGHFLGPMCWPIEALIYSRMDLIHVPTYSKKQLLLEHWFKDPIIAFTNGIEDVWFKQANYDEIRERYHLEGKKIILCAGRLAPEKNIPLVMKAFTQVRKRVPDAHLAIVGDGHIFRSLQDEAKRLNIADSITMTGLVSREELMQWYRTADVSVLYSKVEAQGLVLLEAMAQGTPNVGLNACGIKDVIVHEHTGFLAEDFRDFVERLVQILTDDDLRKEMGKNARVECEMHRMEFVAKTWTRWYEWMIDLQPMIVAKTDRYKREEIIRSLVPLTPGVKY